MKKASAYQTKTSEQHVALRTAMYTGSLVQDNRKDLHYIDGDQPGIGKVQLLKTTVPMGMVQVFKEILSNVADNAMDSREANIDPGKCEIVVKKNKVTITNSGLSIPIKKKKDGKYIIETIFSNMLSGSSLGEVRKRGGAHGIGAKATNILSNEFTVHVKNSVQSQSYKQTWRNNMTLREDPIIEPYKGSKSYVTIQYIIDHKKFGYDVRKYSYCESALQIFKWVAACLSFTAKIPVVFNGDEMKYNIKDYALLYVNGDVLPNHFVVKDGDIECIVMDTPNDGRSMGFANHIINTNGGVHVNTPVTQIKEYIKNNKMLSKTKDGAVHKITVKDIKRHMTVIISVVDIQDPNYGGGQTKTIYSSPPISLIIPDKQLAKIKKWGMVSAINKTIKSAMFVGFGAIDKGGKKGKYLKDVHGEDAGWAGTKRSAEAELHVVEGDSAEGYDAVLLDYIPDGRDRVGTLTLRGKPLNVLKATDETILKNPELIEIIRRLGLEPDVDYTVKENRKKLRYGKLVIMADSDLDGDHIKGLIIGFFHRFYPSLLKHKGFVVDYWTPLARATKGVKGKKSFKEVKFFYEEQLNDWIEEMTGSKDIKSDDVVSANGEHAGLKGWSIRYLKGLGQSLTEDIEDDYNDSHIVKFVYDKKAADAIEMSLSGGKDMVDLRKKWMLEWDAKGFKGIKNNSLAISEFINYFLCGYSVSTLLRNIPTMMDGLTTVARKILYGTFDMFGRKCTSKRLIKVTDFAGAVGTLTAYHHGIAIQTSVIVAGQEFVGSNNIAMLKGKGRFGSAEKGGKHAAEPRYLEVNGSSILPYIYHPDDDKLLTHTTGDNKKTEPHFYLPIIPMSMINGVNAVSTGWRSYIPCHHPLEVIDAFIARLDDTPFVSLTPWYRGYAGEILLETSNGVTSFVSKGIITHATEDSYTVTCLPVGMWNNKYKVFLNKKIFDGELKKYKSKCTATKTYFEVNGLKVRDSDGKPRPITIEDTRVNRSETLTNITLIGMNGFPVEYESTAELMEDFYTHRLSFFIKRKETMLADIKHRIQLMVERRKYISACVDDTLDFKTIRKTMTRKEIIAHIEGLGLQRGFYVQVPGYIKVDDCEKDEEGLKSTKIKHKALLAEKAEIDSWIPKDMWKDDLASLRKAYVEMYPNDERECYI